MKLIARLKEKEYHVKIVRENSRIFADIEGKNYELEVLNPESNVYLLKHDNSVYEVFASPVKDSNEMVRVKVGNDDFNVNLVDPKRLGAAGSNSGGADAIAEIKTAMPGKVVRVLLEEGDAVAKGDGIIVVEAMKMQNEMKSSKDGVVTEIRFKEGETVNAGDVLVIIE